MTLSALPASSMTRRSRCRRAPIAAVALAALSSVALLNAVSTTPAEARRGIGIAIGAGLVGAVIGAGIANAARPVYGAAPRRASRNSAPRQQRGQSTARGTQNQPAPQTSTLPLGSTAGPMPGQIVGPGIAAGVAAGVAAGAAVGAAGQAAAAATVVGPAPIAEGVTAILLAHGSEITEDEKVFASENEAAVTVAFSPAPAVNDGRALARRPSNGESERSPTSSRNNLLMSR